MDTVPPPTKYENSIAPGALRFGCENSTPPRRSQLPWGDDIFLTDLILCPGRPRYFGSFDTPPWAFFPLFTAFLHSKFGHRKVSLCPCDHPGLLNYPELRWFARWIVFRARVLGHYGTRDANSGLVRKIDLVEICLWRFFAPFGS